MVTANGIRILVDNGNSPSLEDIALHTGRMPRFAGATRPWWSVLHHHFVCGRMADHLGSVDDIKHAVLKLYAMLHDAHEAITGDVPRGIKPDILSEYQKQLDKRIYKYFGIPEPTPAIVRAVKMIDETALFAEAKSLGPPEIAEILKNEGHDLDIEPIRVCEGIVQSVVRWLPNPESTVYPHSTGVLNYIWAINDLLYVCKSKGFLNEVETALYQTGSEVTETSNV
jgi:hypothetical protein